MAATRTTGERIVGVGAMCVSNTPGDRLVAHALGSCLAVAVFDPVARVGGLLHVPLPSSTDDRERARGRPLEYVDTGVRVWRTISLDVATGRVWLRSPEREGEL